MSDLGSKQLFWDMDPGLDLIECLVYRYIVCLNGIEARELLVIMTEVPAGRAVQPLDTWPLFDAVGNCLSA